MTGRPVAVNVVTGDLVYDDETFLGSTPAGQGLITWTYDGAIPASVQLLAVAARAYVVRMAVPDGADVTNAHLCITTGGATLTSAMAALYNPAKALIGVSGDLAADWAFAGSKTIALTAASEGSLTGLAAGDYLLAFWASGSTLPTFLRGTVTGTANLGVTGETSRFATADNSLTTTPPDPLGDLTAYNCGFWAGLS